MGSRSLKFFISYDHADCAWAKWDRLKAARHSGSPGLGHPRLPSTGRVKLPRFRGHICSCEQRRSRCQDPVPRTLENSEESWFSWPARAALQSRCVSRGRTP